MLAMFAGVNWREQGRKWAEGMQDPAALFAMPFLRWCGLFCEPQSARETVYKLGDGVTWADVRAKLLERKAKRGASGGASS